HYLDAQRQPQELVVPIPGQPLPFTLRTPDNATNATVNDALYAASGAPEGIATGPVTLKFEYRDSSGLAVVKEFQIEPNSYVLTARASVTENGREVPAAIQWGPAVGDAAQVSSYAQKAEGLIAQNDKIIRLAPKDLAKQNTYEGDFRYAGVDDNYFM